MEPSYTAVRIKANMPIVRLVVLLSILLGTSCDRFKEDIIQNRDQVSLIQSEYFVLPNSSTIIDLQSIFQSFANAILKINQPSRGILLNVSETVLRYKPINSFTDGSDSFTIDVSVNGAFIKSVTITLAMAKSIDQLPCGLDAIEDVGATKNGKTVAVAFLANDRICGFGRENIQSSIYIFPKHGDALIKGDSIYYTPSGTNATDNLVYKLTSSGKDAIPSFGYISLNDVSPSAINFVGNTDTLTTSAINGKIVLLQFSSPVKTAGRITISVESGNAVYGTDFTTIPSVINNTITLTVAENSTTASFTLLPISSSAYGTFNFSFLIAAVDGDMQKGSNLKYLMTLIKQALPIDCKLIAPFGHLSKPGYSTTIARVNEKLYFSSYTNLYGNEEQTDIYDMTSKTWSGINKRLGNIQVADKILKVISPLQVEIYDAAANSFSTVSLSRPRNSPTITTVGDKVIFAGGNHPDSSHYTATKGMDIYDARLNQWSTADFNDARGHMAAINVGNKIYFAGGSIIRYDSLVFDCNDFRICDSVPTIIASRKVNIYDLSLNRWSSAELSTGHFDMSAAVVGNRVLFAGGKQVDIYDFGADIWSTAKLSNSMGARTKRAHTVGNKVLFTNLWSDIVDIYDATNNSWSTAHMSKPNGQSDYLVTTIGNKILFFTVFDYEGDSKNLDIYDADTNTWCHSELDRSLIRAGIIPLGDVVLFAGGLTKRIDPNIVYGYYDVLVDDIWTIKF